MTQLPTPKVFDELVDQVVADLSSMKATLKEAYRWAYSGAHTTPNTTPEAEPVRGGDVSDPTVSAVTSRAGSRAEVMRAIGRLKDLPLIMKDCITQIDYSIGVYVPVKIRPRTAKEREKARQSEEMAIERDKLAASGKRLASPAEVEESKRIQEKHRQRGGGFGES